MVTECSALSGRGLDDAFSLIVEIVYAIRKERRMVSSGQSRSAR